MAERVLPPADDHYHDDPNIFIDDTSSQPLNTNTSSNASNNCFDGPGHSTYVVQVPKDQIYRVPPPENAAIAERLRNPASNDSKKTIITPCASRCCCVLLFVTVLVLALGLAATILFVYFEPKDPKFHVERLDVVFHDGSDSHRRSHHGDLKACNVRLRSENTNARVDMLYREGGVVSLWFRQHQIGVGEFPAFYQERAKSATFDVVLLVRGKSDVVGRLMKEMEKSLKQKAHVKLALKMQNITAKTDHVGLWITGMTVKFGALCDVIVDSVAKGSRVLSQECRTTNEDKQTTM